MPSALCPEPAEGLAGWPVGPSAR